MLSSVAEEEVQGLIWSTDNQPNIGSAVSVVNVGEYSPPNPDLPSARERKEERVVGGAGVNT